MQIDLQAKYSKYADLIPVLTADSRKALQSSVCAIYGEYWDIPLKDYFAAIDGDFSRIGLKGEPTVAQRVWLDGLREFGQEFEKACKQVTIPDTKESHGQRSLVAYSPWSCKELDMTE